MLALAALALAALGLDSMKGRIGMHLRHMVLIGGFFGAPLAAVGAIFDVYKDRYSGLDSGGFYWNRWGMRLLLHLISADVSPRILEETSRIRVPLLHRTLERDWHHYSGVNG